MPRLRLLGKIPKTVSVAVSGGSDSMAILDFLIRGGREVTALHFDHGTEHGREAETFVREYCQTNSVNLRVGHLSGEKKKGESPEEFWRNQRYAFLDKHSESPIITGHQLNDQIENWIFTSLHGQGRLIPYKRGNYIRPFILNKSEALLDWCEVKDVHFVSDPSNLSDKYMRSYIRNNICKQALVVNPGLYKTIRKKILKEYSNDA